MITDKIQARALKTWYPKGHELHGDILPSLIGLVGESGELLNLYKKDRYKPGFWAAECDYVDELGDCLYYLAILAYQHDLTLEQLSVLNRDKLRDGKNGWADAS